MQTLSKFYRSIVGITFGTSIFLLIPLLAMQVSDEVAWSISDFLVAGTLLFGTGLMYKLATSRQAKIAYRIAVGFALFTGLLLIWTNLAVGIIDSENNPINLMYYGVVTVGIIGAIITRFQPHGMECAMYATALAQTSVTGIILAGGLYPSSLGTVTQILGINGFYIGLFILSGVLFRYAAQDQPPINTGEMV